MKYVLVTGAYGGMGCATVDALVARGFFVFAMDRIVDAPKDHVYPLAVDVTCENSVKAAFDTVRSITTSLYAIVHYAGIYMLDSLAEMDPQSFTRIFAVNLQGAFLVNRTFMPLMDVGSRILITTSELAVLDPLPFTGVYAVSKCALDRYAFSLRMELQLRDISVSVLRAGAVDTNMIDVSTDALSVFCEKTKTYSCNADRFRKIVNGVEARRVPPTKVADKSVRILMSKRPRFAYSINRNPLLLLLNALPSWLQFRIIRKILR